jgi:probable HAF family extracellular repeat protein
MSRALRTGALSLAALVGLAAAPAEPPYTIIELGHLGGSYTQPLAINDRRQVVGVSAAADGFSHPFLWQQGVMTDLGLLPEGISASAEDINAVGDVVGAGTAESFPYQPHAILWRRGQVIPLALLPGGSYSQAFAINDWGLIAGAADDGVSTHATVWWAGTPIPLEGLALPTGDSGGWATDVNNLGQVVGSAYVDGPHTRAVLWQAGRAIDLGTLPGDDHSQALAINDRGQIVGLSANIEASTMRAFLWERGAMRDLGIPPGEGFARAEDINVFGVAAGVFGTTRPRVALFTRGRIAPLPAVPNQIGSLANDMNNLGDVVGYALTDTGSPGLVWLRRP